MPHERREYLVKCDHIHLLRLSYITYTILHIVKKMRKRCNNIFKFHENLLIIYVLFRYNNSAENIHYAS